ncbi:SulP family inorganic anion transporter [Elioraea rosea]|uniref:SulP family inorganic anion transporter n=1 Tax=Elioraea rosea TaxID=2492390 RepID=UPI0011827F3B|nr:SulP family inorganic anion transporter [Elioraea rosea]
MVDGSAGATAALARPAPPAWHLFVPKLVTTFRQGYGAGDFRADVIAGLTVAIVALPLAMALAIASGTTPDVGLVTAVVGGFLGSALGGARFNISGPTGAFVVVVFGVIEKHGYDGLLMATVMAGLMLAAAGLFRLGTWIKYVPEPVVVGFTAGIAVIIFSSQIRDLFGLSIEKLPGGVAAQWATFWEARASLAPAALVVSATALALIIALRRFAPKLPAFLVAVVFASLLVGLIGLPVETIGSRFGGIPSSLPAPSLPPFSLARIGELIEPAFTIAFLAGVESLLCAVVADGMTGRRHRSNAELVSQGIANLASSAFGGLPVTGAIARTATSIRAGARSPVAGMLHAVFLLAFMLVAAPLAAYVPLASLAAVLVIVAWNMSEQHKLRHMLATAPMGERVVLLVTFLLTVLVDLTLAIEVGVVLAAILFMHGMAEAVSLTSDGSRVMVPDIDDFARPREDRYTQRDALPEGVEVFQLRGPLFFGAAGRLADVMETMPRNPRHFILRMREVPFIDSTGVAALADFVRRCRANGTHVIVTGIQPQPRAVMARMGLTDAMPGFSIVEDFAAALQMARAA